MRSHEELPAREYLPESQVAHEVDPELDAYVEIGQRTHVRPLMYLPAGQSPHAELPATEALLASQFIHELAPVADTKLPAGHPMQGVDLPRGEYFPATHEAQAAPV